MEALVGQIKQNKVAKAWKMRQPGKFYGKKSFGPIYYFPTKKVGKRGKLYNILWFGTSEGVVTSNSEMCDWPTYQQTNQGEVLEMLPHLKASTNQTSGPLRKMEATQLETFC